MLFDALKEKGFIVRDPIGQGGFARVYTVSWDQYPGKTFVAKVISVPEDKYEKGVQSYFNEIGSLKELFHKNIIQIYKHFIIGHFMVIIMEYCKNGTIYDYVIRNGPLDLQTFRVVAKDLLETVAYCHQNRIAHRDIKPANILLDERRRLKLCDFGLSDPSKSNFVCSHDGSIAFVPPELLSNAFYDPKKADIWSLGITFFFLATGKLPWLAKTHADLRQEILNTDIDIPYEVPTLVKTLILQMIRKNPNARYSAEQLLKHTLFDTLPFLKLPQKIRKSDSNDNTSKHFTLAAHFYNNNKGYTCRIQYKHSLLNTS